MADIYTIGEALQKSKLLSEEDGYRTYCNGTNHYVVTPSTVTPSCGCNCDDANAERPLQDPVARPRYEIYNKDADFSGTTRQEDFSGYNCQVVTNLIIPYIAQIT